MSGIDDEIKKIKEAMIEEFEKDFVSTANYSTKLMKQEVQNLYNSMITQFYKYHTKSYIRHWEGRPGTEEGQNLYYGLRIIDSHSNRFNTFRAEFDAHDMAGGYQHHSRYAVLDYVVGGTRFTTAKGGESMSWSGSYSGNYFSIENAALRDAFKSFFKDYETHFSDAFMERWNSLGW